MSARSAQPVPVRRFSRQWFLAGLRTAGWVAVVTVLVWVYADIQLTEPRDMRATLRIHTTSQSNMVLLSSPEVSVQFRVKGNRQALDRFADQLAAGGSVLRYDAARALEEPGRHSEPTVNILESLSEFRRAGLEIVSAHPKNIEIVLDELKLLPGVRVQLAPPVGGRLAEPPKIVPNRIDLRVPATRLAGVDPTRLWVPTEVLDLTGIPPGKPVTRELRLRPPPEVPGARLGAEKVQVTFTVLQQTDSRKFKVPVRAIFPNSWLEDGTWSRYRLEAKPPEDWTREITVVGKPIDLEKLKPEDIDAYIELNEADKQRSATLKSWWPGKVKVRLPTGLDLRLGEPLPADLQYKLKRIESAPAP